MSYFSNNKRFLFINLLISAIFSFVPAKKEADLETEIKALEKEKIELKDDYATNSQKLTNLCQALENEKRSYQKIQQRKKKSN